MTTTCARAFPASYKSLLFFNRIFVQPLILFSDSVRLTSWQTSDRAHPGSGDTVTKRKTHPTEQEESCGNTYHPSDKLPTSCICLQPPRTNTHTHTHTQSKHAVCCFLSPLLLLYTHTEFFSFADDYHPLVGISRMGHETTQLLNCLYSDRCRKKKIINACLWWVKAKNIWFLVLLVP